jgi:hypothetical protein
MLPVEIVVCACSVEGAAQNKKYKAKTTTATLHAFEDNLARHNDLRPRKPLTGNIGHFPFNMFVPPWT